MSTTNREKALMRLQEEGWIASDGSPRLRDTKSAQVYATLALVDAVEALTAKLSEPPLRQIPNAVRDGHVSHPE